MSLTIHYLHHIAASLAIASGADVKLVHRMLGHRDATETLNTYTHLWPDRIDEIMNAVSEHRKQELRQNDDDESGEAAGIANLSGSCLRARDAESAEVFIFILPRNHAAETRAGEWAGRTPGSVPTGEPIGDGHLSRGTVASTL